MGTLDAKYNGRKNYSPRTIRALFSADKPDRFQDGLQSDRRKFGTADKLSAARRVISGLGKKPQSSC